MMWTQLYYIEVKWSIIVMRLWETFEVKGLFLVNHGLW